MVNDRPLNKDIQHHVPRTVECTEKKGQCLMEGFALWSLGVKNRSLPDIQSEEESEEGHFRQWEHVYLKIYKQ